MQQLRTESNARACAFVFSHLEASRYPQHHGIQEAGPRATSLLCYMSLRCIVWPIGGPSLFCQQKMKFEIIFWRPGPPLCADPFKVVMCGCARLADVSNKCPLCCIHTSPYYVQAYVTTKSLVRCSTKSELHRAATCSNLPFKQSACGKKAIRNKFCE